MRPMLMDGRTWAEPDARPSKRTSSMTKQPHRLPSVNRRRTLGLTLRPAARSCPKPQRNAVLFHADGEIIHHSQQRFSCISVVDNLNFPLILSKLSTLATSIFSSLGFVTVLKIRDWLHCAENPESCTAQLPEATTFRSQSSRPYPIAARPVCH